MSLEQVLNNLQPQVRGAECKVATLYRTLTAPDGVALGFAIQNQNLTARQISEALASEGITLSVSSINRHRRRGTATGCRCQ